MWFYLNQYEIPRWAVMWCLAAITYAPLKILTWACRSRAVAPLWKHAGYLLAWPGMDVDAFLYGRCAVSPTVEEWWFAIGKTAFATFMLLVGCPFVAGFGPYVVGWTCMLGLVFALHFGLFHILSCIWRSLGVQATPIMNWPIAAQSLTDFWSRRWNLAFRDLANRFVFRPLVRPLGPSHALLASFVVSGLVHDLVVSVPAGGGYGLPTMYFTLQGLTILAQRTRWGVVLHLTNGLRGRLVTCAVLMLPLPLLFHGWFVCGVIIPFIHSMRP
jgi:hypothetical protein